LLVLFVGVGVLAVGMLVVVGSSSFGMFGFDVVVGFDDGDDDDDGPCAKKGARGINVVGCSEDGAGTGTTTDGLDN
jgi:hypothetical protein